MSKPKRVWREGSEIDSSDSDIPVRQVYVWLLTSDEKMIIVSKNGDEWQLPGGKPEPGEPLGDAAVREVNEETGINIADHRDKLRCFGYYAVSEPAATPAHYLQVRYYLNLPQASDELHLHAGQENTHQPDEDMIRFVGAVSIRDIATYIPWLPTVDEYRSLTEKKIINS